MCLLGCPVARTDKPPLLVRNRCIYAFAPLLFMTGVWIMDRLREPWWPWVRLRVVIAGLALIYIVSLIHAIRFRRSLKALDFAVCLDCGYLLRGLPDEHVCPECGRAFRLAEVREAWRYHSLR